MKLKDYIKELKKYEKKYGEYHISVPSGEYFPDFFHGVDIQYEHEDDGAWLELSYDWGYAE